ncbi:MAG TPA: helix-turn-helix transcriptional regulator [Streptosporangiaceae bacterium]|jgi:transcriptional regulator with XRE-family HTH domain|nr:helix-turn-helix transcriptional regulator [Streptosporangiaceae bacterium]
MASVAGTSEATAASIGTPPDTGSPTVLRILVGAYLRRLREARRISMEDAAYVIRGSHSKISRLEAGRVSFKSRDVADLLTLYGVTDERERDTLQTLAMRANAVGWWREYADVLPSWLDALVGLEDAARQIRAYEVQFVPGLLQTEDYACGVVMLRYSNPSEINRRVALRMERQAVLARSDPPSLEVVLDEAVLRRAIGGTRAMQEQLKHLIEMSERPNVTIQVIPFRAGGHAAAGGAFSLLHFSENDLHDVVYMEQLTGAQYLDNPDTVVGYRAVMDELCGESLDAASSLELIRSVLRRR